MISSTIIIPTNRFLAVVLRGMTGFGFGLHAVRRLSVALPPAQLVRLSVKPRVTGDSESHGRPALSSDSVPGLAIRVPIDLLVRAKHAGHCVRLAIAGIHRGLGPADPPRLPAATRPIPPTPRRHRPGRGSPAPVSGGSLVWPLVASPLPSQRQPACRSGRWRS